MKNREKFFVDIVCNVIILSLIVTLATFGLASNTLSVFSSNEQKAIYNGDRESKFVSLMFNVYWGEQYIEAILATLDKHKVKATFFVGGCWVEKQGDKLIQSIVEQGHELGNHGYFHKDCKKSDRDTVINEIRVTHEMIKTRYGVEMKLFAPPSGSFDSKTLEIASNFGYQTVMWSKDTIDWRDKDSQLVYTRATKDIKGGDLVLMHPSEHTLLALDKIITFLLEGGFEVVTVSQNISGSRQ